MFGVQGKATAQDRGLIVSQLLTLYTTPVAYVHLDRFRLWVNRVRSRVEVPALAVE